MDFQQRLEKHTIKDPRTECWLWTGSLSKGGKSEGYGRISIDGRVHYVHRVSAHIYHNISLDKDTDLQVLHNCPNKNCWNPEHLYVGRHTDNMADLHGYCLAGETKCRNGHDLSSPVSYYSYGKGQRKCKQCRKDYYKTYGI
jgi:hypothetical protein